LEIIDDLNSFFVIKFKDAIDMNNIKRVVNLVRTLITNILNLKQLIQTNEKPKGILKLIYKKIKVGTKGFSQN